MTPFNDESTVISIVPFTVVEFKPGMYPGNFRMEPCMDDRKPEILVVKPSYHLMTVGGRKDPIRILTASYIIAEAIVNDFLNSQLWSIPGQCPGICWIQGRITREEFMKTHTEMYERIKENQKRWFMKVVAETNNDWAKYRNTRVVSPQAKFGAQFLGLDVEWLREEEVSMNFNRCPACSTMNDRANAVCTNCRCILDAVKYETLTFAK